MKFDEQGFRHLVDETIATIIRLGTTSHAVLDRYERFTEMLVKHLKSLESTAQVRPSAGRTAGRNADRMASLSVFHPGTS